MILIRLFGILGVDGFGREVVPVAHEMILSMYGRNSDEVVFVDKTPVAINNINGYRVISEEDFIEQKADEKFFNIAIADYRIRERLASKFTSFKLRPFQIKAINTIIYDNNIIGEGAILCPFTTITSNVTIGKFFHANIYSYVAHDCVIGDFVTFAPSVCCNGRVIVEDYAYIGTGAIIRQGSLERPIVIGEGAVIGMGAVVTKSISPYTTVVGNPASIMK